MNLFALKKLTSGCLTMQWNLVYFSIIFFFLFSIIKYIFFNIIISSQATQRQEQLYTPIHLLQFLVE